MEFGALCAALGWACRACRRCRVGRARLVGRAERKPFPYEAKEQATLSGKAASQLCMYAGACKNTACRGTGMQRVGELVVHLLYACMAAGMLF
eukprot:1160401-Pelagomonas_calceolata.AAC.11